MSTLTAPASHIRVDDKGGEWIAGTTFRVTDVVLGHLAHGWSPEEIHFQHPQLSMGQIHSALAYYCDHNV